MLEIRKAGQGDLEGLNQLYLQLTSGDHGLSPEFPVIFAQMQEDRSYHLMVAIGEDKE